MSSPLTFVVDASAAQALLGTLQRQLPYALSRAINDTAFGFRDVMRRSLPLRFTIRRPSFNLNQVQVTHTSTKADPVMYAEVAMRGPETGAGFTTSTLAKFETAGIATARNPDIPFAIPSTNIRPSFTALAPRNLLPKNLGLVPYHGITGFVTPKRHVTAKGVVQLKGARRTFVLDPATMFGVKTWGIYQRTGPGKDDVRLLWTYKSTLPRRALLGFHEQAQLRIPTMLQRTFDLRLAQAIQTAK